MTCKHLTLDFEFVCFTDDTTGIAQEIRTESLPIIPVEGWWFKPIFFDPNLCLNGTILFLDLDLIIFENIDKLFEFNPGKFCIIQDFNRASIKNIDRFNSSVFRLETGQNQEVFTKFVDSNFDATKRFLGDQEWIRHCVGNQFVYWPTKWIQSYKWEMRGRPSLDDAPNGQKDFKINGDPHIQKETAIAVFHGNPNPHVCKDQWVIDNWQNV